MLTLHVDFVVKRTDGTAARSHPHHLQETNIVEVKAKAGVRPVTISVISFLDDLSAEESEVLRKLLNDAIPAQMDLKVGDAKSSSEMRALVVSSASPSRER